MGGVSPNVEERGQRAGSESWEVSPALQSTQRSGVSWEEGSAEGVQGGSVSSQSFNASFSEGSVFPGFLSLYM